jgi:hypothetical protein
MKVGDLVKVILDLRRRGAGGWPLSHTRAGQLGVITEVVPDRNSNFEYGYMRALLTSGEEYWFETNELELADESR